MHTSPELLAEIEARARAATYPRLPAWDRVLVSPDAVIFHDIEQLREFVRAEILRAATVNQLPAPPLLRQYNNG